ncbi:MAG: hypothetical protein A2798_03655 [Candidatus Levybacteria bacterium RIFCSPHIGHO2_01_FULL_37_17]|nr:MAG: hypothetical protein A2798_03655 [Candidatus Levybacteria bacterium RIFCSPHIGHO2_01_FULL_37_17]OGH36570.1 MAG: hypothetical protein A2959_03710 [Candidatus Levybacteria bacterium RIFCSPLOWO2_01_FULL_38_23]
MERNPLGLLGQDYEARKAEMLQTLNPQQKGVFTLLENLYSLTQEGSGITHEVWFNHSLKTDRILSDVVKGKISSLPIPGTFHHLPGYERLIWRVTQFSGDYTALFMIKMMFYKDAMYLHADQGQLRHVSEIAQRLVRDIPYPIVFKDGEGFRYENPAYLSANTPS